MLSKSRRWFIVFPPFHQIKCQSSNQIPKWCVILVFLCVFACVFFCWNSLSSKLTGLLWIIMDQTLSGKQHQAGQCFSKKQIGLQLGCNSHQETGARWLMLTSVWPLSVHIARGHINPCRNSCPCPKRVTFDLPPMSSTAKKKSVYHFFLSLGTCTEVPRGRYLLSTFCNKFWYFLGGFNASCFYFVNRTFFCPKRSQTKAVWVKTVHCVSLCLSHRVWVIHATASCVRKKPTEPCLTMLDLWFLNWLFNNVSYIPALKSKKIHLFRVLALLYPTWHQIRNDWSKKLSIYKQQHSKVQTVMSKH